MVNTFSLNIDYKNETDREVSISDVYQEIDALRKKHDIKEFDSCCVSRKYAFEIPGIPSESDYLKVVYPFDGKKNGVNITEPALPAKTSGKSFSHLFGTGTSALELFLLKRKMMGPCWIKITDLKLVKPTVFELY